MHNKLSWAPQINNICSTANRLGFLKQNLYHASQHTKEHVYKQFLLSPIEYWSALWDPYHQSDVSKLEVIQHCSARFILMALRFTRWQCNKHALPPAMAKAHHSFKLAHLQSRLDIYKHSFLPRTITLWNSLRIRNLDAITLDEFKNCLTSIL